MKQIQNVYIGNQLVKKFRFKFGFIDKNSKWNKTNLSQTDFSR